MTQQSVEAQPATGQQAVVATATAHQVEQAQVNAAAVAAILALWVQLGLGDLVTQWLAGLGTRAYVLLSMAQEAVAAAARNYVVDVSIAAGDPVEVPYVSPIAFAGIAADGTDLEVALLAPVLHAQQLINRGANRAEALRQGRIMLERFVRTQVSDAGREADQVALVAAREPRQGREASLSDAELVPRPGSSIVPPDRGQRKPVGRERRRLVGMGYIRMLSPPSCARCILLSGKWYASNAGFLRHPACDCRHVPLTKDNAELLGLVNDPNRVFDAMTPQEQDRIFTQAGAQAVRDGADVAQVVAARDGMSYGGISKVRVNDQGRTVNERHRSVARGLGDRTTKAGTTRRGFYGSQTEAGRARLARLTPQEIYRQAGTNQELAVALLTRYGYIIP